MTDTIDLATEGVQKSRVYRGWPGGEELWAESKIDGWRMHAMIDADGTVTMRTRRCTAPYDRTLARIAAQIATLGLRNVMLDGEIVAADFASTSIIRRKSATAAELEGVHFHAFDLVPLGSLRTAWVRASERAACLEQVERLVCPTPLRDRRRALVEAFAGHELANVTVTEVTPVSSTADVIAVTERALAAGFEGTVVKDPEAPYIFGDRSGWWKVKPFHSVDVVVVDALEGQDDDVLGALMVRDATGHEFRVGAGFDTHQRRELWRDRAGLIGAMVEVKVQLGTRARHPSFLRFRPDRIPA